MPVSLSLGCHCLLSFCFFSNWKHQVVHKYVSSYCSICVLILLYMCPHTTIYVSSWRRRTLTTKITLLRLKLRVVPCMQVAHTCVLILLYMCPHNTTYVSSYYYICVLILLCMCPPDAVALCALWIEFARHRGSHCPMVCGWACCDL